MFVRAEAANQLKERGHNCAERVAKGGEGRKTVSSRSSRAVVVLCRTPLRLNVPLTVTNGQIFFEDGESVSLPRRFYRVIER